MLNGCNNNLNETVSMQDTNLQFQRDDCCFYDSVLNEIPKCPSVDYCHAAAFRFNLPSCEKQGEENEYLAFVVPRKKPEHEKQNLAKETCYPNQTTQRQTSQYCRNNRWDTEYRGTIDECARKLMGSQSQCKRSPIYPKPCISDVKAPFSSSINPEKSKRERLPSMGERRERCTSLVERRCQSDLRNVNSAKKNCEDNRNRSRSVQKSGFVKKLTDCHKPLMIEPFVVHDKSPEECLPIECGQSEKSHRKPLYPCIPEEDHHSYPVQRSTARPMKRCQFICE